MVEHETAHTEIQHRYGGPLANEIEARCQAKWDEEDVYRVPNPGDVDFDPAKPKYYCLDMFPYPSGAGLHVGHPLGYIGSDILSRYKRMVGFNVLHPMGFDAFGLPAEQYAVQTGVHPRETTMKAIETYTKQLKMLGMSYDWSRCFRTIDENYYRWTQWIWLKAYNSFFDRELQRARPIEELRTGLADGRIVAEDENGNALEFSSMSEREQREYVDSRRLAYLGEQAVNWCPKLGTVLANEEVIDGRSERGGFPVIRKPLRQWMFRITEYASRLLADLELINWPDSTRIMQQEWIGRSDGAMIRFSKGDEHLDVFTTRPDTVFGATYMVVAPEHPLVEKAIQSGVDGSIEDYVKVARNRSDVERMVDSKTKTGVFTGMYVENPLTGEDIPIWTADYVLMGYGTGAIMAVPAHDQRDYEFARTFNLPIRQVVSSDGEVSQTDDWTEALGGDGIGVNSSNDQISLDGLTTENAKSKIIDWLESKGLGRRRVNYKLRDWLFSRQRYWGEPFPIVFDEKGDHYPVSVEALPVVLPDLEDYQPIESDEPQPPLAKATEWVNTTAGEAGVDSSILPPDTPVRRETNTMPGWAGSCWYYLRYCDPHNNDRFVSREAEEYWLLSRREENSKRTCPTGEENFDATEFHVGGVDLYIGGAEHAVLHLLYARFWHKILFDLGEVSTPEPIGQLFHQGMLTAYAFKRTDGSLVPVDEVDERSNDTFIERSTGKEVEQIVAKMSKSLRNVENPDHVVEEYGADTFRLYEMYMGPLDASAPWNARDIVGVHRFLQRAWRLAINEVTGELNYREEADENIERELNKVIAKVGDDVERLAFNTAIAAMIEFVNAATGVGVTRDQLGRFVRILAPFAPHVAEELWDRLGYQQSIVFQPWPEFDQSQLVEDSVEMVVQVLGKVRSRITVPSDADEAMLESTALGDEKIQALIEGKTVRKVIVVPGKLVNIVVS